MNDSKINESIWKGYLKKYDTEYQIKADETGIKRIICKTGTIQPYSIIKQELCYENEFISGRALGSFKRKLLPQCTITQEGDSDIVVKFPESMLTQMVPILQICKKRQL
jgi:hypothetical protein